jgi:hypothetical protein
MMPLRRRTRAQSQAQQIAYERALNQADIDAQEAFDRQRKARQEREAAGETADAAAPADQQDIPPPREIG